MYTLPLPEALAEIYGIGIIVFKVNFALINTCTVAIHRLHWCDKLTYKLQNMMQMYC